MAMQALILAAGRGSRLGLRTTDTPKPLLQIGPKHLFEHQLEMLAEAGVGPVGMVLGYQADEISEVVGIQAEYIYNPRWATTNSLYSFLQAKAWWAGGPLIVMNCDILLHPEILERLLESEGDAFAYDSSSGDGREHMKVQLEGGFVRAMSKTLPPERTDGENVGILYFKAETVQRLFETGERIVAERGAKDWLGIAVQAVARDRNLQGIDIAGLPWAEIDFSYDLNRARKEVWTAIQRRRRIPRRSSMVMGVLAFVLLFVMGSSFYQSSNTADPVLDWDTIPLTGAREVKLLHKGGHQKWWQIGPGQTVEAMIRGPNQIRIESRLTLSQNSHEAVPYLVAVYVDDHLVNWLKHEATLITSVQLDGEEVSKLERSVVDFPEGTIVLRLQLQSTDHQAGLIRIRESEVKLDEDQ